MPRKPKTKPPKRNLEGDLWINPHSNIRGPDGNRAWDNQGNISPDSGSRFLDLADTALGIKRVLQKKKKPSAAHPRVGSRKL